MGISVLHVSYSDTGGGASYAARRLVAMQRASGIDAHLLVFNKSTDLDWVHPVMHKRYLILQKGLAKLIRALVNLCTIPESEYKSLSILPTIVKRRIHKFTPDIVHLHWVQGEMLPIYHLSDLRCPLVWSLHDVWPLQGIYHLPISADQIAKGKGNYRLLCRRSYLIDKLMAKAKRHLMPNSITFVAPSSALFAQLQDQIDGHHRLVHIPNPLPDQSSPYHHPSLLLQLFDSSCVYGLFVSSDNDYVKGFDLLCDSVGILSRHCPHLRILVVGPLTSEEVPKDIRHHFVFLGRKSHADVCLLYKEVRFCCIPSRFETFCYIAYESSLGSCPVVAFRTSGLMDTVLDHITGIAVEPFDTAAFAAAMQELYESESLSKRLGSNLYEHVQQINNHDHLVSAYHSLYVDLLASVNAKRPLDLFGTSSNS